MGHRHKFINSHFHKEEGREYCFPKLPFISLLFVLISVCGYSQQLETFIVNGFTFSLERKQLTKVVADCSDYLNKITLKVEDKVIFEISICGIDATDVQFINKGYLTVLEHYSSSVGWFEYHVFDVCKKRIIKTKRIDQGVKLNWEGFIELKPDFKSKYVDKVTEF